MADDEERWRQLRRTKGNLIKIARLNKVIKEKEEELAQSKERSRQMCEARNADRRPHGSEQRRNAAPVASNLSNPSLPPLSSNESGVDVYAGTDEVEVVREKDLSDRENDDVGTEESGVEASRRSDGEGQDHEDEEQKEKRSEGLFVTDDEAEGEDAREK